MHECFASMLKPSGGRNTKASPPYQEIVLTETFEKHFLHISELHCN